LAKANAGDAEPASSLDHAGSTKLLL